MSGSLLAKPCTIRATAQITITGLEAFTEARYSNCLLSIPGIWFPGALYGLAILLEASSPKQHCVGQLLPVNRGWLNKKDASLENLGKTWIRIPSLVSFAHVYDVLTLPF